MIKFGTGGWRAIIADEFTKENLRILAQAMSLKMIDEGVNNEGIVIGYDRRFLSKESMVWLAEVFAGNAIPTKLINKSCPTPLVMFYVNKYKLHYGMMVTASHNPAIYNGVKVFTYGGKDADETSTKDIERYIQKVEQTKIKSMKVTSALECGLIKEFNPINEYIDSILETIDIQAIRDAQLNIALDPMYGVSETSIRTILTTCRCHMEIIHGRHDPLFGGHLPAPDAKALEELGAHVRRYNYDLGIATDGDADRIGVVDDTGRYLSPNDILVLLYWYLETYKGMHGPCVRNLCTTHTLDRLAKLFDQPCFEVPVGFKWVTSKMEETNAIIGGESSGGMAVNGHIKGKDGVYAAALLVEMIAVTKKPMSVIYDEIIKETGKLYFKECSYPIDPAYKKEWQKKLLEQHELPPLPYEIESISDLDGVKVRFCNGGYVSIRFSGTEPLIRVFTEMEKEEDTEAIALIFQKYLKV